jgi:hypothetical protein
MAAQTVAAADAAAAGVDLYIVDGKVPPLGSARYTSSRRHQAAFTASSRAQSYDGFCLFK